MGWTPTIKNCDDYLSARTGNYKYRAIRYRAAVKEMQGKGLSSDHTVFDLGAGWTEFDFCLRAEFQWRGRYVPVDGGIDGTDLHEWTPPRRAEFFVALEIIEHLSNPLGFLRRLQEHADIGIIISTPNPETTDVLAMDPTHITPVYRRDLESLGFRVQARMFYGKPGDSLLGTWWACR